MKIRSMLTLSAVCFALIPMIAYTVFANIFVSKSGNEEFLRQITDLTKNQVASMQAVLDNVHDDIDTLSSVEEVRSAGSSETSSDGVGELLIRFANENPTIVASSLYAE